MGEMNFAVCWNTLRAIQYEANRKNLDGLGNQQATSTKFFFVLSSSLLSGGSMHTKQKGNLGELTVAADLARQGYYVFTELGDVCKADLIVMDDDYIPVKVQVKYAQITPQKTIELSSRKAGPNYRFKYELKHADVYAVYVFPEDTILYVSNTLVISYSRSLTFRLDPPKNNQTALVRWAKDYISFERALRDCTRSTPPSEVEGNDTVQTTTLISGLGNQE